MKGEHTCYLHFNSNFLLITAAPRASLLHNSVLISAQDHFVSCCLFLPLPLLSSLQREDGDGDYVVLLQQKLT